MKVNRKEIVKILSLVSPGLGRGIIVEDLSRFFFTGECIITYNGRICISYPFCTDFQCSVDSEKVYKLLSHIPDEEVELSFASDKLTISGKNFTSKFTSFINNDDILGYIPTLPEGGWGRLPRDFIVGLNLCGFSTSKDASIRALTGVYISGDTIISSDDLRISKYIMRRGISGSVLIPSSAITEMKDYNFIEYVIDGSWIHFGTKENVIFSVRRIEEDYEYDWEEFFEISGEPIELPKELKDVISTVSILASGEIDLEKRITVVIDNGNILCRGEREQGSIRMEIQPKEELPTITFSINPVFLSQILDQCSTMFIGEDKAWFKSDRFSHVMALPLMEITEE